MTGEWKWHFVRVRRLKELLDRLEDTDFVAATDIGTLAIVRNNQYIGFVDTWGGGDGIQSADETKLQTVEFGDRDGQPYEVWRALEKAVHHD